MHFAGAVALVLTVEVYLLYIAPPFVVGLWLTALVALQTVVAADRGRRMAEELARPLHTESVAAAVADAMFATGLSPCGSDAVTVTIDGRGRRRWTLAGVDAAVNSAFAVACDEVLAPVTTSGYVVRRLALHGPVGLTQGLRTALGRLRPNGEVWHRVPTLFGETEDRAHAFAEAWHHWVGGEAVVHSGTTVAQPARRQLAPSR